MTKPIFVLNGPNLNRLGKREPEIYGTTTLAEIEAMCRERRRRSADPLPPVQLRGRQIVDWIHEAIDEGAGIIINPAGLSFTSIAILDALKMFPGPIVEFHISNIHRREAIYHHSLVSTVATAVWPGSARAAIQWRCGLWPDDRGRGYREDLDRHRFDQRRPSEKLAAIAAAGFDGVEIFENDFLAFDGTPARSAAWSVMTASRSRSSSRSATSRACPSRSARAPSIAPSASST